LILVDKDYYRQEKFQL